MHKKLSVRGQSIIEYTMIVAMLMMALFFMGTSIKRGVQSVVKVTADQVGNQQDSEQEFNDVSQGYMALSNSAFQENKNNETIETGYINKDGVVIYTSNTSYNEAASAEVNTITNGAFAPDS